MTSDKTEEEMIEEFRQSDVYKELFSRINSHLDESDNDEYDTTQLILDPEHEFEQQTVSNEVNDTEVRLGEKRDSGYRTLVKCVFEDGVIKKATIDIGQQVGPLAGRGHRITYEDGEYKQGRWIS